MSKFKKLIIVVIFIAIICLIIFFSKDYIIRQYFINKIKSVDYDEYILTTSYNGKKKEIKYYTEDACYSREYDENENLRNLIIVTDYTKEIQYEYNVIDKSLVPLKIVSLAERPLSVNNNVLIQYFNHNKHFTYKGMQRSNNRECYTFIFEDYKKVYSTIYLDKELLYIVREEIYNSNINNDDILIEDKYTIIDYELDLKLEQKDIFDTEEIKTKRALVRRSDL